MKLFYGNPNLVTHSELLLAPGTHTMVSLVRQTHRTVVRRLKAVDIFPQSKPCNDTFEYTFFKYSKLTLQSHAHVSIIDRVRVVPI